MVSSFSVNDSLKKKSPNERMFALADISDNLGLMGLISTFMFLLPFFVCFTLTKDNGAGVSLFFSFFSGLVGIMCFVIFHVCITYFAISLKSYGLHKNQTVWLIDFKNKRTVLAKIVGLKVRDKNFNETYFNCTVDGEIFSVLGDDIFDSEEAAASVLKYVTDANSCILNKFYPGWKTDPRFIAFYNQKFWKRFGFGRISTAPYTPAVVSPVMINGRMYIPESSIQDLFEEFFGELEREEVSAERDRLIIRRVNAYKSPFCP